MSIIFSIIIPVYNRAHVILNALESVKFQSFTDFECIVVDDCSSDDSISIVEGFIETDKRFKLLKHTENKGASGARNTGILNASGKYISFLDSDDIFYKDFLKKTFEFLSDSDQSIGFAWTGCKLIYGFGSNRKEIISVWQPNIIQDSYLTFLHNLHIGTGHGVTIKAEVFDNVDSFREDLPAAEDTEFFLRLAKKYNFRVCPDILVEIDKTGYDRLSKRMDKLFVAYVDILQQHNTTIKMHKRLRLKYYYKMQWLSYYGKNKRLSRSYFVRILYDNFFCAKAWALFICFETLSLKTASFLHQRLSK